MIDLTKEGGLWTVTLNRPDKANSLTAGMLEDLAEIAETGAADDSLRAFVLPGAGDRVFSAGADLEAAKAGLAVSPLWERMSGAIAALPCLTSAALNGTLAGGAFGMALACDIRIAVPGAKFFYPVAKLGYLPQPSDPGRLAALVGPARARMIYSANSTAAGRSLNGYCNTSDRARRTHRPPASQHCRCRMSPNAIWEPMPMAHGLTAICAAGWQIT